VTARRPRGGSKPRVGEAPAEHTLRVRLDPTALDRWRAAAEARGATLSELVREAVEAHLAGDHAVVALAALATDVLDAVADYQRVVDAST